MISQVNAYLLCTSARLFVWPTYELFILFLVHCTRVGITVKRIREWVQLKRGEISHKILCCIQTLISIDN